MKLLIAALFIAACAAQIETCCCFPPVMQGQTPLACVEDYGVAGCQKGGGTCDTQPSTSSAATTTTAATTSATGEPTTTSGTETCCCVPFQLPGQVALPCVDVPTSICAKGQGTCDATAERCCCLDPLTNNCLPNFLRSACEGPPHNSQCVDPSSTTTTTTTTGTTTTTTGTTTTTTTTPAATTVANTCCCHLAGSTGTCSADTPLATCYKGGGRCDNEPAGTCCCEFDSTLPCFDNYPIASCQRSGHTCAPEPTCCCQVSGSQPEDCIANTPESLCTGASAAGCVADPATTIPTTTVETTSTIAATTVPPLMPTIRVIDSTIDGPAAIVGADPRCFVTGSLWDSVPSIKPPSPPPTTGYKICDIVVDFPSPLGPLTYQFTNFATSDGSDLVSHTGSMFRHPTSEELNLFDWVTCGSFVSHGAPTENIPTCPRITPKGIMSANDLSFSSFCDATDSNFQPGTSPIVFRAAVPAGTTTSLTGTLTVNYDTGVSLTPGTKSMTVSCFAGPTTTTTTTTTTATTTTAAPETCNCYTSQTEFTVVTRDQCAATAGAQCDTPAGFCCCASTAPGSDPNVCINNFIPEICTAEGKGVCLPPCNCELPGGQAPVLTDRMQCAAAGGTCQGSATTTPTTTAASTALPPTTVYAYEVTAAAGCRAAGASATQSATAEFELLISRNINSVGTTALIQGSYELTPGTGADTTSVSLYKLSAAGAAPAPATDTFVTILATLAGAANDQGDLPIVQISPVQFAEIESSPELFYVVVENVNGDLYSPVFGSITQCPA